MLTKAVLCAVIIFPSLSIPSQAQTTSEQQNGNSIAPVQEPAGATIAQASDNAGSGAGQAPSHTPDSRDRIYYPGDTERLKPLGIKLFKNILLDQKDLWTSPFRMKKKDLFWWIGIPAVTAALIVTDNKTIDTFENSKGQITWGNHISKIGASYTLIPLVAGFYGYGVWKDQPKAREVGVLGAQALLDSLIIVEILKPIAGRNRPNSAEKGGDFFQGGVSFPSGHAIESWSLASVIAHEYGRTKAIPIVVYSLATVVSLSRFAGQQHFASDIFFGAAAGWFIGRYVYKTHMDHAIHKHGWMRPQILPKFDPGQRMYGVTLAFGN